MNTDSLDRLAWLDREIDHERAQVGPDWDRLAYLTQIRAVEGAAPAVLREGILHSYASTTN